MRTIKITTGNTTAEVLLYSVQVNFKSYGHRSVILDVHFGSESKQFTFVTTASDWVDMINDLMADDNIEALWDEYVSCFESVRDEVEQWVEALLSEEA